MALKARNQLLGKFARWITVAGNSQDKTVQACETLDSLQIWQPDSSRVFNDLIMIEAFESRLDFLLFQEVVSSQLLALPLRLLLMCS